MSGEGVLGRRYRALTVGVVLATSVIAFEGLALTTIAPVIARDLEGIGLYGWVFSAFLLPQLVGTVAAGQQADRRGPALPFAVSLVIFGAGLLVGALAPSMGVLVVGRAVQGLGAGALFTCVYTIVNTGYPDRLRPRMLAAVSSAFVVPSLIGPALAGFVAEQFTWRAVFYGLLPFLVVVGALAAPVFRRAEGAGRGDGAGGRRLTTAVALVAGTGLLLAGFQAARSGSVVLGFGISGAGLLVALLSLRALLPDGTFLARPVLPAVVAARGLFTAGYFCAETYLVLALTSLGGYRAAVAGLMISAGSLSWTAGTWAQERLERFDMGRGVRVAVGVAVILAGLCVAVAPVVVSGSPSLGVALAGWVAAGLGMGLAHPTCAAIAFARAPEGKEGTVSSSLLLADLFTPAVSIGFGGALVALGAGSDAGLRTGIEAALGLAVGAAALGLLSALRLARSAAAG